jgi:hypothetical protein
VFRLGVPRGNLQAVSREIASANTTTNAFELNGHGFEDGDSVTVRAAEGGWLASPLVEDTTYYVKRVDGSRFQLSESSGGAAVDLTTAPSSMFVAAEPPFAELITAVSQWIYDLLPAHARFQSIDAVPMVLRVLCAELVGKKAMALCGHKSESVDETEKAAMAKLERWSAGLPNRASVDVVKATSVAVRSTFSTTASDSQGWGSGSIP